MQKVSKQSLAMLALSILLAISIALTFTFAALQDSKTATGTITFQGGVGLVYDGLTNADGAMEFSITYSDEGKPTLAVTGSNGAVEEKQFGDIALKIANTSQKANVTATIAYYRGTDSLIEEESQDADYVAIKKYIDLKVASWNNQVAGSEVVKFSNLLKADAITSATDFASIVDATDRINKIVITFNATVAQA